ncbi:MAG: hypothetical protein AAFQ61_11340 [Cyanobacteria bacterium J06626_23]
MDPTLLRQLWSVVEDSHSSLLLSLDDSNLVEWLLSQLAEQSSFDPVHMGSVSEYIRAKLPLIRDIAQG